MSKPEDKTVLVVDDEEDVRDYLGMALEDAGFNVILAADGNEALEKIKEKPPDFISLDLVMPGKSGIMLMHELRRHKQWKNIPFVIVTAHAQDDLGKGDLEEIMSQKTFSGPSMYLEKPVKPEQYVGFISKQLGVVYEIDQGDTDTKEIRSEINRMLDTADPEQLAKALRLLKKT